MEPISKQEEHRYFHCSDCDLTVHENDRDNHINGGRHKYRIRRKKIENDKPEPQFQCSVCDTELTDIHFYNIHQGSKTHKRNLRRIQKSRSSKKAPPESSANKIRLASAPAEIRPIGRRVAIQGIDRYLSVNDFKDVCDYKSIREKYRSRNTKNPEGNNKTYITSVTAYWAISLALEPTVKDFKISVNDKEWADFGDAVVEIDLKETKDQPGLSTTFAIQFKDISNNVKSIDSFNEGRFGVAKYIAQVNAIKLRKEVENKKFVLFTTAVAEVNMGRQMQIKNEILHKPKQACDCKGKEKEISVVSKTLSNRRKLLINTSEDNDNIFFFFCTDNMHTLPRLYLYTHQKKQKHFGNWIDNLLSGSLYGDTRVDNIHREFIKYVECWSDGYLGGNYKLKKEDVLVKLGHLLLYSFKVPPVVRTTEKQNYRIWQHAVNNVDITILKKHPVIISKICEPLNVKIETELNLKIDTTTRTIDLDQSTIKNIQNPVLKMYLFEETMGYIQDEMPLDLVYDFFWKAGMIPLLLQVNNVKDQEYILNVVSLLKSFGLTRRYFLMTQNQTTKNYLRLYKTLSFFVNVDDIANKIPSFLLDYIKISVTDNFSLSLKSIQDSDMFFQKTVSAHEFFDMSLGRYSFKPFSNNLARNDGHDTQLVLGDEAMIKLKEEIESIDEMKMVLLKYENDKSKQFLRGVRPNLFS